MRIGKSIILMAVLSLSVVFFYFIFSWQLWPQNFIKNASMGALYGKDEFISQQQDARMAGEPVRLVIPSIKVDAAVQYVGLTEEGDVGSPDGPNDAAWFGEGVRPGEVGSAVITGHYGRWKNGSGSVFDNLDELKEGDKIYVTDKSGSTVSFTVKKKQTYNFEDSVPEIFAKNDGIYLNLITCKGEWLKNLKTYSDRLVVFAEAD